MATSEVKEQKVYVCLPPNYIEGKHILSWALSQFPKDETTIVISLIFTAAKNFPDNKVLLNMWRQSMNEALEKHLTQCAMQKFKAEKLMHDNDDPVKGILELIDLIGIKNLVMGAAPNGKMSTLVAEKANPECKIWFVRQGNLVFTRYPKSDFPATTSEENEIGLNVALRLMLQDGYREASKLKKMASEESKRREEVEKEMLGTYEKVLLLMNNIETEFHRREKLHQKETEEIQTTENNKKDLLRREIEQLKLENQLLRNQRNDNLTQLEELNKQKLELENYISSLKLENNKLKQEWDNAIKEAQELRNQKEHTVVNSDVTLSSQFSSSELEQATQNFSDSLKIGVGGFGCVYKGSLRKTTVAIKKLNSESLQGLSQFQQEVAILTTVRHPNLVTLIGSCSEISALIYEFLPNGSLEDCLDCANNTPSLTWQARTRIISEICLALVFLHSNKPHIVIHGDLKPENILLDENFMSKLSDFGISRIIKQSDSNTTAFYHTTHPAGTFAYMDPQFLSTGQLTTKSDVYSFGIIVLRLLTGKPPLYIASEVQEAMRSGRLQSIVDKSAGKWPFELAKKLAKLGLRCADMSRRRRPDMGQVWSMIDSLVKAASQSAALSSVGSSTFCEERVPSHFICPILQEIMKDPCIAADGFTYEAEAIKTWLNTGHNTSPMTNLILAHHDLIPNYVVRSAIQEWIEHQKS
ncbi:U-box domain-containing protein kinase family protein [Rhynchospora pubera]|uniref:RING-type E3 ubiquitin transferase n=1 Tax=Rhynchospora pubera TaxID=906938 RepID=A0AAV8F0K0_9POAL|nr:U-box domain-containing protein kinase family protein [Rhynchospora pubera]